MLGVQPIRLVVVVEAEEETEGEGEVAEEGCCHVEELSMEGERDLFLCSYFELHLTSWI